MLRDSILQKLIPALLVIVCINQLYLAFTKDLTPWKGGGFGMFATIDRMERRPVHITVNSDIGKCIADPRDVIENQLELSGIRALPTDTQLERIARLTSGMEWVIDTENSSELDCILKKKQHSQADSSVKVLKDISEVEVRIYKFNFDTHSDSLSLRVLNEYILTVN